ncbi:MAG: hypothetical protein ACFFD4_14365 [Candidatus Odinarchaeota archaeon]
MDIIGLITILVFVVTLVSFIILLIPRSKTVPKHVFLAAMLLLLAMMFHALTNILEWAFELPVFDSIGDYVQILVPVFYFITFFVYSMERSKMQLLESKKSTELYQDLLCHDFGNILQVILSTAERSALTATNEIMKERIDIIVDQALKGSNLITTVRNLIDFENGTLDTVVMDITAVINAEISKIIAEYNRKTAVITFNISNSLESPYFVGNALIGDIIQSLFKKLIHHDLTSRKTIDVSMTTINVLNASCIQVELSNERAKIPHEIVDSLHKNEMLLEHNFMDLGLQFTLIKRIISSLNGQIYLKQDTLQSPAVNRIIIQFMESAN